MRAGGLSAPSTYCMGASGRLTYSRDNAEVIDAFGLFHHAGASDGPGLVADAARGPRGDHSGRPARLSRRLHGRASDRRLREHHQQHDVPGDAHPRHQNHQARHRHHQSRADAPGGGRGERGDVRPSGARPLRHGHQRRRADLGLRKPSAFSISTATRSSPRRSTSFWRCGSAIRLTTSISPTTASRSVLPAPPRSSSASACWRSPSRSRGRRSSAPWWRRFRRAWSLMGKRDFHPLSANFLLAQHLKSHWTNYAKGKAEAGQQGQRRRLARGAHDLRRRRRQGRVALRLRRRQQPLSPLLRQHARQDDARQPSLRVQEATRSSRTTRSRSTTS